jgi:hypothetical protein
MQPAAGPMHGATHNSRRQHPPTTCRPQLPAASCPPAKMAFCSDGSGPPPRPCCPADNVQKHSEQDNLWPRLQERAVQDSFKPPQSNIALGDDRIDPFRWGEQADLHGMAAHLAAHVASITTPVSASVCAHVPAAAKPLAHDRGAMLQHYLYTRWRPPPASGLPYDCICPLHRCKLIPHATTVSRSRRLACHPPAGPRTTPRSTRPSPPTSACAAPCATRTWRRLRPAWWSTTTARTTGWESEWRRLGHCLGQRLWCSMGKAA